MATKPPRHNLPQIKARCHAREVYDRQTRRMTMRLKCAADVRNSSFWKKVRETKAARNPTCENPHGFHGDYPPPLDDVHHIVSIEKAPHLAFVHSNLMSVCKKCHAVFSAQERQQ